MCKLPYIPSSAGYSLESSLEAGGPKPTGTLISRYVQTSTLDVHRAILPARETDTLHPAQRTTDGAVVGTLDSRSPALQFQPTSRWRRRKTLWPDESQTPFFSFFKKNVFWPHITRTFPPRRILHEGSPSLSKQRGAALSIASFTSVDWPMPRKPGSLFCWLVEQRIGGGSALERAGKVTSNGGGDSTWITTGPDKYFWRRGAAERHSARSLPAIQLPTRNLDRKLGGG